MLEHSYDHSWRDIFFVWPIHKIYDSPDCGARLAQMLNDYILHYWR